MCPKRRSLKSAQTASVHFLSFEFVWTEGTGRDYKDVREIFGVNRTGSRKRFSEFVLHRKIGKIGKFPTTTLDAIHQVKS